MLIHPQQKQRHGGHQSRRHGDGKSQKLLTGGRRILDRGQAVETCQPKRAADEVDGGDEPAQPRQIPEDIRQHDPMHQKRRGGTERNHVRQRIELAPEGTFPATQPRNPAVQQVEDAGQ